MPQPGAPRTVPFAEPNRASVATGHLRPLMTDACSRKQPCSGLMPTRQCFSGKQTLHRCGFLRTLRYFDIPDAMSGDDALNLFQPVASSVHSPGPARHAIHWEYLVPIATVHLLAGLVILPWCFSWSGVALALIGTMIFGTLGINLCYHRLLSHRSLAVPQWLERILATFALCSLEDTPARWVANHRLHHCHSDTEPDPHSPRDGIVWSHMGWLFRPAPQRRSLAFLDRYARDILADKYYRTLERHPTATLWIYLAHAALFGLTGLLVGYFLNHDWHLATQLAASWVVWGVFLRTVLVWHITWSVNSLTHLFGYRTYTTGEDSRNNWLVALLAMGEGWHNNHHHDPASASVQHRWWEFDVTYYFILLLKSVGLATNVIQPRHDRQGKAASN